MFKKVSLITLATFTAMSTSAFAGGYAVSDNASNNSTPAAHDIAPNMTYKDGSLESAILNGDGYVNFRYRFENVDQDGFADEANASTLRTNLGYKTGEWNNLSATIEVQNVTEIGNADYNDTINGKATPVVADPASTEVNHAYLTYTGVPSSTISIGRQDINLGNERFVGTVGWRQNDQTFDSIVAVNTHIDNLTAIYAYVDEVKTVNGDDHPLGSLETDAHFLDITYALNDNIDLRGYGYFWEVKDVAALSAQTFGVSVDGTHPIDERFDLTYRAEYALQSDYKNNTANYDANYYDIELGLAGKNWSALIGYEVLGADGAAGVFITPLATGHKFNGWADKFLATPANGLEDLYISASYIINCDQKTLFDGIKINAQYHKFDAEQGGADYGDEFGIKISKQVTKNYSVTAKYANYDADQFSSDTEKFVLMLGAKF